MSCPGLRLRYSYTVCLEVLVLTQGVRLQDAHDGKKETLDFSFLREECTQTISETAVAVCIHVGE